MPHVNPNKLGLAGALTVGICYTALALFLWMWPVQAWNVIASAHMMTNMSMFSMYMKITLTSYLIGVTQNLIYSYAFFWLLGFIYCMMEGKHRHD